MAKTAQPDPLTLALKGDDDASRRAGLDALADEMRLHGTDRAAPVRELFALLGDRWSLLLLLVLETGRYRHAALRRVVSELASEPMISQRVMTAKLRALERLGIVDRAVTPDVPPRVDYALTATGQGLVTQARALIAWIERASPEIERRRREFDARED